MSPIASLGTVCGPQRTIGFTESAARAVDHRRMAALHGQCQTKIIMDFVLWASTSCPFFPTVVQVQERFSVSRATAFRWRRTLADALCLPQMPRNPCPGFEPEPLPMAPLLRGAGGRA
ncbi:hypothetical protein I5U56_06505 [Stenotrophomonas maltophilia]|nr:hypothetical protein [Stenotrophomonas maltophilia]MBH1600339.1 hypothetical protein [Stenotrophomonas maltophilia]